MGLMGIIGHISNLSDPDYTLHFRAFVFALTFLHAAIGIGLLTKAKSAFYLFKIYLHLLMLAFPIGTYIAKKTLEYIEKNNIKDFFR